VTALSLPYGDGEGNEEIITAVKRNGYKFVRTSRWGAIENAPVNLFELPGFPMLDTTRSSVVKSYLKF
jgi:DNA-binding winged helix-turn-helix (wHTH) protein